jgi:hypothetical protein
MVLSTTGLPMDEQDERGLREHPREPMALAARRVSVPGSIDP